MSMLQLQLTVSPISSIQYTVCSNCQEAIQQTCNVHIGCANAVLLAAVAKQHLGRQRPAVYVPENIKAGHRRVVIPGAAQAQLLSCVPPCCTLPLSRSLSLSLPLSPSLPLSLSPSLPLSLSPSLPPSLPLSLTRTRGSQLAMLPLHQAWEWDQLTTKQRNNYQENNETNKAQIQTSKQTKTSQTNKERNKSKQTKNRWNNKQTKKLRSKQASNQASKQT